MKHGPQIGCYSLLFRAKGHRTDAAQIDFAHVVRLKEPQPPIEPQPIDVIAAEQMAVAVLDQVADSVERFQADGNAARFTCNPSTFSAAQVLPGIWETDLSGDVSTISASPAE